MLDENNSGYITKEDLDKLFQTPNEKGVGEKLWSELLSPYDKNGDGGIEFSEFKEAMIEA